MPVRTKAVIEIMGAINNLTHPLPMENFRGIMDALTDGKVHFDRPSAWPTPTDSCAKDSTVQGSQVLNIAIRGTVKDDKLLIEGRCWHCGKRDCYEHCNGSDDGKHQLDGFSVVQADMEGVVDVSCKNCGQSGSVSITEVNWE